MSYLNTHIQLCFMYFLGFGVAVFFFFLKPSHLVTFYLAIASMGVIGWSYILNVEYVKYCSDLLHKHSSLQLELFSLNKKAMQVFLLNYVQQSILSFLFCFSTMNLPKFSRKNFLISILFMFPLLINAALPSTVFTTVPVLVAFIAFSISMWHFTKKLLILFNYAWIYLPSVSWNFSFDLVRIVIYFKHTWNHFQVTKILQLFSVIRFIKNFSILCYDCLFVEFSDFTALNFSNKLVYIVKQITIVSFENILTIFGIAFVFAFIVDKTVYQPVLKFISVESNVNLSDPFSVLLILLCVEFGVADLVPEQRFNIILNINWMMATSILFQINFKVCKHLIHLSVIGNVSYKMHARALIVACFILVISSSWLMIICTTNLYSMPILFGVIIFNVEILIYFFIDLIIYSLNLIHYNCYTMWYELYDYRSYLEITKRMLVITFSTILFLRGCYKIFDHCSILRMLFLLLHFYHNVWCELINVWHHLKKKQLIYDCVKSLLVATIDEVEEIGGICVICQNDVTKHIVCITRCNHFFHVYCLRKWLWERKTCPICHRLIRTDNFHVDEMDLNFLLFHNNISIIN